MERPPAHTVLFAALEDLDLIGDERRTTLAALTNDHVRDRAAHAKSVRQNIQSRWGQALDAFEICVAAAEVLNGGLLRNFFGQFRTFPRES